MFLNIRLLFLEFGDRKSMQRSHLQCSSEMPQNPKGEQQGSPLCGSHSAIGPPSHARLGNPHLPVLLILIPAIFRRIHFYCFNFKEGNFGFKRSLNTQSCNRRLLCSTFTFENVSSTKKKVLFPKYSILIFF